MASVAVRTATGLLLAALVVAALFGADSLGPGIEPWLVGFGLSGLAGWELGRMGRLGGGGRALTLPLVTCIGAVLLLAGFLWFEPGPWGNVALVVGVQVATVALGAAVGPTAPEPPAGGAGLAGHGLGALLRSRPGVGLMAAWVGPAMASLALVHATYGTAALATLLVLSKLGDIAGYFVGRAIGKRHPFPYLSPGKTTAGCVASLVAGTAGGVGAGALGLLPGTPSWLAAAAVGAVLNVAAQAADLAESFVKRTGAVKDSSAIAGASGGVLDVIDSLLLTLPLALVLFAALHA